MYYWDNIIAENYAVSIFILNNYNKTHRQIERRYRASRTASILLDTAWKAVIGRLEPYQASKTAKR